MHAVGARALYSATFAPRLHHIARLGQPRNPPSTTRCFVSSPIRAARPNEPNAEGKDNGRPDKVNQRTTDGLADNGAASAATQAEAGATSGNAGVSGEARGRSSRGRISDAMPPVNLPGWFADERVLLYGNNEFPADRPDNWDNAVWTPTVTSPPEEPNITRDDLLTMFGYWERRFTGATWDSEKVSEAITAIAMGDLAPVSRRGQIIRQAAALQIAALAYAIGDEAVMSVVQKLDPSAEFGVASFPFAEADRQVIIREAGRKHRILIRKEADELASFGRTRLNEDEALVCAQLRSTIHAELLSVAPKSNRAKDVRRPVSVLTILNYSGSRVAKDVINQTAYSLRANVIHLDATFLAEIVGGYLGQSPYWGRGNISQLGYTAAEKTGQMTPRYQIKTDDTISSSAVVSHISSSLVKIPGLGKLYQQDADDRWESLKISHVLEEIVNAAASKKARESPAARSEKLILHVHNYIELCMTDEGAQILNKLRAIVDRLWQKGQQVVMVGSTSFSQRTDELQDKMEELSQEGCHLIPMHLERVLSSKDSERHDKVIDNATNIRIMVSALGGKPTNLSSEILNRQSLMRYFFRETVYDVDWVYRIATLLLGNHDVKGGKEISFTMLWEALHILRHHDSAWEHRANAQPPYYTPLNVEIPKRKETEPSSNPSSNPSSASGTRPSDTAEYNEWEKKLLPSLINARDIKTTFDDVVCPPEVKESIIALTSLSLIRPEAFLYGVLAAERIPGCLLYGPPGTGKTLMARAVAKQSGASMLEVSPATVNDMWVGNAEKKVQALFTLAKKMAPMVIFLDEADSLLGARSARPNRGGYRETLNQFLREWDGVTDTKAFIMVATNRPFDLDDAVMRRLPRKILMDLPLKGARLDILRGMLRDEVLDSSVSLEALAAETELYSGSDLKNLCVAAAMEAVKEEVRARDAHEGAEPFVFPEKRILTRTHMDKALKEIGASISEDMSSLQAIRKFDERFGDARRKKRRNVGFEVVPSAPNSKEARVRQQPVPA